MRFARRSSQGWPITSDTSGARTLSGLRSTAEPPPAKRRLRTKSPKRCRVARSARRWMVFIDRKQCAMRGGAIRRKAIFTTRATFRRCGAFCSIRLDLREIVSTGPPRSTSRRTSRWNLAASDAILIVDGTFLQRDELSPGWDVTVFVQVAETTAMQRGTARDQSLLGGLEAAQAVYDRRYRPAFRLYERACRPLETADVVFDNECFERPTMEVRRQRCHSSKKGRT